MKKSALASDFSFPMPLKVLVADNNSSSLQHLTKTLLDCDYEVLSCSSGSKALDIIKDYVLNATGDSPNKGNEGEVECLTGTGSRTIHLALISTTLEDLSSTEFMGQFADLRQHQPKAGSLPVIFVSTANSRDEFLDLIRAGAVDVLVKPVRKNEISLLWQHAWRASKVNNLLVPDLLRHQSNIDNSSDPADHNQDEATPSEGSSRSSGTVTFHTLMEQNPGMLVNEKLASNDAVTGPFVWSRLKSEAHGATSTADLTTFPQGSTAIINFVAAREPSVPATRSCAPAAHETATSFRAYQVAGVGPFDTATRSCEVLSEPSALGGDASLELAPSVVRKTNLEREAIGARRLSRTSAAGVNDVASAEPMETVELRRATQIRTRASFVHPLDVIGLGRKRALPKSQQHDGNDCNEYDACAGRVANAHDIDKSIEEVTSSRALRSKVKREESTTDTAKPNKPSLAYPVTSTSMSTSASASASPTKEGEHRGPSFSSLSQFHRTNNPSGRTKDDFNLVNCQMPLEAGKAGSAVTVSSDAHVSKPKSPVRETRRRSAFSSVCSSRPPTVALDLCKPGQLSSTAPRKAFTPVGPTGLAGTSPETLGSGSNLSPNSEQRARSTGPWASADSALRSKADVVQMEPGAVSELPVMNGVTAGSATKGKKFESSKLPASNSCFAPFIIAPDGSLPSPNNDSSVGIGSARDVGGGLSSPQEDPVQDSLLQNLSLLLHSLVARTVGSEQRPSSTDTGINERLAAWYNDMPDGSDGTEKIQNARHKSLASTGTLFSKIIGEAATDPMYPRNRTHTTLAPGESGRFKEAHTSSEEGACVQPHDNGAPSLFSPEARLQDASNGASKSSVGSRTWAVVSNPTGLDASSLLLDAPRSSSSRPKGRDEDRPPPCRVPASAVGNSPCFNGGGLPEAEMAPPTLARGSLNGVFSASQCTALDELCRLALEPEAGARGENSRPGTIIDTVNVKNLRLHPLSGLPHVTPLTEGKGGASSVDPAKTDEGSRAEQSGCCSLRDGSSNENHNYRNCNGNGFGGSAIAEVQDSLLFLRDSNPLPDGGAKRRGKSKRPSSSSDYPDAHTSSRSRKRAVGGPEESPSVSREEERGDTERTGVPVPSASGNLSRLGLCSPQIPSQSSLGEHSLRQPSSECSAFGSKSGRRSERPAMQSREPDLSGGASGGATLFEIQSLVQDLNPDCGVYGDLMARIDASLKESEGPCNDVAGKEGASVLEKKDEARDRRGRGANAKMDALKDSVFRGFGMATGVANLSGINASSDRVMNVSHGLRHSNTSPADYSSFLPTQASSEGQYAGPEHRAALDLKKTYGTDLLQTSGLVSTPVFPSSSVGGDLRSYGADEAGVVTAAEKQVSENAGTKTRPSQLRAKAKDLSSGQMGTKTKRASGGNARCEESSAGRGAMGSCPAKCDGKERRDERTQHPRSLGSSTSSRGRRDEGQEMSRGEGRGGVFFLPSNFPEAMATSATAAGAAGAGAASGDREEALDYHLSQVLLAASQGSAIPVSASALLSRPMAKKRKDPGSLAGISDSTSGLTQQGNPSRQVRVDFPGGSDATTAGRTAASQCVVGAAGKQASVPLPVCLDLSVASLTSASAPAGSVPKGTAGGSNVVENGTTSGVSGGTASRAAETSPSLDVRSNSAMSSFLSYPASQIGLPAGQAVSALAVPPSPSPSPPWASGMPPTAAAPCPGGAISPVSQDLEQQHNMMMMMQMMYHQSCQMMLRMQMMYQFPGAAFNEPNPAVAAAAAGPASGQPPLATAPAPVAGMSGAPFPGWMAPGQHVPPVGPFDVTKGVSLESALAQASHHPGAAAALVEGADVAALARPSFSQSSFATATTSNTSSSGVIKADTLGSRQASSQEVSPSLQLLHNAQYPVAAARAAVPPQHFFSLPSYSQVPSYPQVSPYHAMQRPYPYASNSEVHMGGVAGLMPPEQYLMDTGARAWYAAAAQQPYYYAWPPVWPPVGVYEGEGKGMASTAAPTSADMYGTNRRSGADAMYSSFGLGHVAAGAAPQKAAKMTSDPLRKTPQEPSAGQTARVAALARYLEKKKRRTFTKKVLYESRKRLAETRHRVKGQFVGKAKVLADAALALATTTPSLAAAGNGDGLLERPAEERAPEEGTGKDSFLTDVRAEPLAPPAVNGSVLSLRPSASGNPSSLEEDTSAAINKNGAAASDEGRQMLTQIRIPGVAEEEDDGDDDGGSTINDIDIDEDEDEDEDE